MIKSLLPVALLLVMTACSSQPVSYTAKPTLYPTRIASTPVPKDKCYEELNPLLSMYSRGVDVDVRKMYRIAKSCASPRVYASLQFGVRMGDRTVAKSLIK